MIDFSPFFRNMSPDLPEFKLKISFFQKKDRKSPITH